MFEEQQAKNKESRIDVTYRRPYEYTPKIVHSDSNTFQYCAYEECTYTGCNNRSVSNL
jgi:hypothetical protein